MLRTNASGNNGMHIFYHVLFFFLSFTVFGIIKYLEDVNLFIKVLLYYQNMK